MGIFLRDTIIIILFGTIKRSRYNDSNFDRARRPPKTRKAYNGGYLIVKLNPPSVNDRLCLKQKGVHSREF